MKQITVNRIHDLLNRLIQSSSSRQSMIAAAQECDGRFILPVDYSGVPLSVDLDVALRVIESDERETTHELKSILSGIGPIESEFPRELAAKIMSVVQWRTSLGAS